MVGHTRVFRSGISMPAVSTLTIGCKKLAEDFNSYKKPVTALIRRA